MLCYFVLGFLLPCFVVSQSSQCYRCFGSNWCNDFRHPEFASNVHTVECPSTNNYLHYEGNNPITQGLLKSIRNVSESLQSPNTYEGTLMGCLTATVHEEHENHTVRVCINQASIICGTVRNVVLSNVNDISPDVEFTCEGCTNDLCNTHTFVDDPSPTDPPETTEPPTTTILSTTPNETPTITTPTTSESSTASSEPSTSFNPPTISNESTHDFEETPSTTEEVEKETDSPDSAIIVNVSYKVLVLVIGLNYLIM